jgi:CheY-like chemotaxis protein
MVRKILVADDSIATQNVVALAFEHESARVESVNNGEEAFDKLGKFLPDIVLTAVDTPGLTGFELSKIIKEDAEFEATKVILLINNFGGFNEAEFQESGADDYILKSFKPDDIVKKVNDLLSGGPSTSAKSEPSILSKDTIEPAEPVEATIELSASNMVAEGGVPDEINRDVESLEDALEKMIKDIEPIREMNNSAEVGHGSDDLAEVASMQEEEIGSKLDMASHRVEDLGQLEDSTNTRDDRFAQAVNERVKLTLERSLSASIEKEIANLSDKIAQSVREVVREITPGIAREIIKEEIDKIKKS